MQNYEKSLKRKQKENNEIAEKIQQLKWQIENEEADLMCTLQKTESMQLV
jgi:hypothetical protein